MTFVLFYGIVHAYNLKMLKTCEGISFKKHVYSIKICELFSIYLHNPYHNWRNFVQLMHTSIVKILIVEIFLSRG